MLYHHQLIFSITPIPINIDNNSKSSEIYGEFFTDGHFSNTCKCCLFQHIWPTIFYQLPNRFNKTNKRVCSPNTRIEIFGLSWIILHYDNGNSEQLLIACKDCNFLPSLIRIGLNVAHCREDRWWFRWSFVYQWFVDDFCLVLCSWIGFLHFFSVVPSKLWALAWL